MADDLLIQFLTDQKTQCGGQLEVAEGAWALFALDSTNLAQQQRAHGLLAEAPFAWAQGDAEDDVTQIIYVDKPNRAAAIHWIDDQLRLATGQLRRPTPAQRKLLRALQESEFPHKIAMQLRDDHAADKLSAGVIAEDRLVRSLLDRLHQMEPLFFNAFMVLLENHLIDLLALGRTLIDEDIKLKNQITAGSLSQDPFLQSRQDAAAAIRNKLIEFQLLNPVDQQRHTDIKNPYQTLTRCVVEGDQVKLAVDTIERTIPIVDYVAAIHGLRLTIYTGQNIDSSTTQSPWVTDLAALPLRAIKQQLLAHRNMGELDFLYMLERAVTVT